MIFQLKDRAVKISYLSDVNLVTTTSFINTIFPVLPSLTSKIVPTTAVVLEPKEVKSIEINLEAGVAVEEGIKLAFIQPWYIKPCGITITGASYIGAYPYITNNDTDAEDILNKFISTLGEIVGNKQIMRLDLINNPTNSTSYAGFMTNFKFDENIDSSFILPYTINFIGKPLPDKTKTDAKKGAAKDMSTPTVPENNKTKVLK